MCISAEFHDCSFQIFFAKLYIIAAIISVDDLD